MQSRCLMEMKESRLDRLCLMLETIRLLSLKFRIMGPMKLQPATEKETLGQLRGLLRRLPPTSTDSTPKWCVAKHPLQLLNLMRSSSTAAPSAELIVQSSNMVAHVTPLPPAKSPMHRWLWISTTKSPEWTTSTAILGAAASLSPMTHLLVDAYTVNSIKWSYEWEPSWLDGC